MRGERAGRHLSAARLFSHFFAVFYLGGGGGFGSSGFGLSAIKLYLLSAPVIVWR
jgi:hypothetical protein